MSTHGGARKGAGRPVLPAKAKQEIQRTRIAGASELFRCLALLRGIRDDSTKHPVLRMKAALEIMSRFGAAPRQDLGLEVTERAVLTPELIEAAARRAAEMIAADPTRGAVQAVDAEYEIVNTPGNGEPRGLIQ